MNPVPIEGRFRNVRRGDTIVCPGDGRKEKVTLSASNGLGKWRLRTDRHDHIRDERAAVTIIRPNRRPARPIGAAREALR